MTIVIRRGEPEDYEAVRLVYAGPKAYSGTLQLPFPSADLWRKRMAEPPEGFINLVACVEGEIVGHSGVQTFPNPRRRHAGKIGMAVRDDWQGKGVGSALMQAAVELADNWLNLSRLELEVYVDNAAALHLYEKFGFRIEGTLVRYAYRDGRFVDAYTMARLRK